MLIQNTTKAPIGLAYDDPAAVGGFAYYFIVPGDPRDLKVIERNTLSDVSWAAVKQKGCNIGYFDGPAPDLMVPDLPSGWVNQWRAGLKDKEAERAEQVSPKARRKAA